MSAFSRTARRMANRALDRFDKAADQHEINSRRRRRDRASRRRYRAELNNDADLARARAAFDGVVALHREKRLVQKRVYHPPCLWIRERVFVDVWVAKCMSSDAIVFDEETEVKYGPPHGEGKTRLKAVEDLNRRMAEDDDVVGPRTRSLLAY